MTENTHSRPVLIDTFSTPLRLPVVTPHPVFHRPNSSSIRKSASRSQLKNKLRARELNFFRLLKTRNLLILSSARNAKIAGNARDGYAAVTRSSFGMKSCRSIRVLRTAGMDMGCKSELLKHPNGVPVEINFIPLQPVPRRNRIGVMVVMPPISETHEWQPTNCWSMYRGSQSAATPKYARPN